VVVPEDQRYARFTIEAKDMPSRESARPKPGWYYVVYKDGYKSFSPPEAFEEGYTRI
jgi:hypothetical protein